MPPTLYLIDGHALAYRTYYALTRGMPSRFTTRSGEPTAGIYGFASVLLRILAQERPEYMAVAFDTGKTFRDEIFPEYKATRKKMPEDLRPQIERIRQLVDTFNIPRLEVDGYEADDVLGSVAKNLVDRGLGVKIFTGDRDLLQLVDERIIVNLPGKSLSDARDYKYDDVREYMGVSPDQIVDYKALAGDKSDNIPGITGIGVKTATSLLKSYGDLDKVYDHLDDVTKGVRKKLIAGRESAYLSKKLAAIVTDLKVPINLDQARTDSFKLPKVESLFRELEFRQLMTRLNEVAEIYGKDVRENGQQLSLFSKGGSSDKAVSTDNKIFKPTKIVDTPESLQELIHQIKSTDIIAIDTETTSTDQMSADLVGISFAVDKEHIYYIPLGHRSNENKQLPLRLVLDELRSPLVDQNIAKVGHNIKYDYVVLARHGLRVTPLSFDTMIAEWLINPNSRNLGLKNLAWVRLGYKMINIEELIGKGKKQISMADVDIQKTAEYAGLDAAVLLQLMPLLKKDMETCKAIDLFYDLEMPLIMVLAEMEMAGIALDTEFLQKMSQELNTRVLDIEEDVHELAGKSFNLNSPQQLSKVLFDKLEIPPPHQTRRTASGYYSTAAKVLEELRGDYDVVNLILKYRELTKLKSTYLDALPLQVNPETKRVHTSYNQTGSVTGRIASSNPNLQNIPIRTEVGRKVRQAFVANPGNVLISVDYSQVELRIVAHLAKDKALTDAFLAGQDIHATTAAAIYDIPLEEVTKEQRRHSKAINFGLIYGMTPYGLTRSTDLTLAEAENFVKAYFKRFPRVKEYLDSVRKRASRKGYVETLLGRRRYFPGLTEGSQLNRNARNREEREAINAPVQGTAADIIKIAMLKISEELRDSGFSARMLLQVHDELVLECPENKKSATVRLVSKIMENCFKLDVPLSTDARCGNNWDQLKPCDE